jgi:hypothetical protein
MSARVKGQRHRLHNRLTAMLKGEQVVFQDGERRKVRRALHHKARPGPNIAGMTAHCWPCSTARLRHL